MGATWKKEDGDGWTAGWKEGRDPGDGRLRAGGDDGAAARAGRGRRRHRAGVAEGGAGEGVAAHRLGRRVPGGPAARLGAGGRLRRTPPPRRGDEPRPPA